MNFTRNLLWQLHVALFTAVLAEYLKYVVMGEGLLQSFVAATLETVFLLNGQEARDRASGDPVIYRTVYGGMTSR